MAIAIMTICITITINVFIICSTWLTVEKLKVGTRK